VVKEKQETQQRFRLLEFIFAAAASSIQNEIKYFLLAEMILGRTNLNNREICRNTPTSRPGK